MQSMVAIRSGRKFTVYVTGFGPFPDGHGGHFDLNASHEVIKLLPAVLDPQTTSNPNPFTIELRNPTAEQGAHVKVEYAFIREYIQKLHQQHNDDSIDLFLHVGMAYGWDYVSVERCAYNQRMTSSWAGPWKAERTYYMTPDDAGKTVDDLGPCPWDDLPIGIRPNLDIDEIIDGASVVLDCKRRFGSGVEKKPIQVKQHEEAGSYCCGFIYYESMANRLKHDKNVNVLFCHVPSETDTESLQRARDAIIAVIASAARQLSE